MSELMRREDAAADRYNGGHWPTRGEQKALRRVEGMGAIARQIDVERGRRTAQRQDITAAVAGRTMERAVDLINYRRELAAGDPDIELELLPIQRQATRQMTGQLGRLFDTFG